MLKEKLNDWLGRAIPNRSSASTAKESLVLTTDIGLVRLENQDRVACMKVNTITTDAKPFIVIALSDGMGGMRDGAKCAALTISSLFENLIKYHNEPPTRRLIIAANKADEEVHRFSNGYGGATLSAILITSNLEYTILNIGDSRVYAEFPDNTKSLERLTTDDSLAEAVGGTNKDLIQFIGMGFGLKPHAKRMYTKPKKLLLTSDGVHFINEETFYQLVSKSQDLSQLSSRLLTFVRWSGAPDNASLAVITTEKVQNLFLEKAFSEIEFWDAFSELYVATPEALKLELTEQKEYSDKYIGTTETLPHPNTIKNESTKKTPPTKPPKKPRPNPKNKKNIETKDNLQIVIDMDSTRMESTDDSSK